ncbi:MAG: citramalate synthase, partial [Deltaproteobacteria bacterium]|nr:citramalate synthase [Deltaproteobacteria bacterium]
AAETPAVTIFGKSWDLHATDILGVSLDDNLKMIEDTAGYLKEKGREVIYDAEHFFDGYKRNPEYALKTLDAALNGGSDIIVLCDTNGGTLPHEIGSIMRDVMPRLSKVLVGIHAHNDCGLAVANSIEAVRSGAVMVQGTINGYGERCGNADLISIIGNLQLKMGYSCLTNNRIRHLTELSRYVSDVANVPPINQMPFTGVSAFAHKAGVHVSAIQKNFSAYEHIEPDMVGNRRRVLVSDLSGKSNIEYKTKEMDIKLGANGYDSKKIVNDIKKLEDMGYQFEAAEGSLELLIRKAANQFEEPFSLESLRVTIEKDKTGPTTSQATIKVSVGDEYEITAAEGDGPVNAMDNALRKALTNFFPEIGEMKLVDFKVMVIEGTEGTGARVRVRIDSGDAHEVWSTVGVSENIIEASWQALVDSIQYKLLKDKQVELKHS